MVSQNQELEGVQAPLIEEGATDEFAPPPDNPIIAEVDRLNNVPEVNINEVSAPEPVVSVPEPVVPAPEPVAETSPEVPPIPGPQQPSPEQIQQMQAQAAAAQQQQEKTALQAEGARYQQQLEAQGYLPEQAQSIARQHMQSRIAQTDLIRKADNYGAHLLGKQAASEHFAQKYNLGLADLPLLRTANNEQEMEQKAKDISEGRSKDAELTQLRQAQVPAQQFDNSQGAPEVAANDDSWLDRYNQGDTSPNALAAAKRLLGI